ncbi:hypothetical protein ScPMuIL_013350 [Solemya velum]
MITDDLSPKPTDVDSLRFVHCLTSRDPNIRNRGFEMITRTIDTWLGGYGSPPGPRMERVNGGLDCIALVQEQLGDLLRLSVQCPFDDVREKCINLLEDLKERGRGLKVPRRIGDGPCRFIPENEVMPVNTTEDQTQMLYVDAFLQNNRLDHVTQLVGFHPSYLECFLRTQQFLLREDGPLPFDYRHFIAIMAAGRHQCSYLINLHTQEFILKGGDPAWLRGLNFIPKKLRDLYEINKLLAHRPWLITKSHIEKLTRGTGKDNWSLSELMHALILLSHFHALASFVYGCGIHTEIDHTGGHSYRHHSTSESNSNDTDYNSDGSSDGGIPTDSDSEVGIEILMERMRKLTEEEEETTHEERLKRFEKVESQSVELTTSSKQPSPKADILKFVDDSEYVYQDFAKRGSVSEIPTFRAQDYSWEDHGFSLANRLYAETGTLLDDKFRMAYNLTYYTMGEMVNVDTTAFRRAIWNYIHCMYGIRHDDYNYGEVNHLLERSLKAYIKTVTCYPERLTKKDYDNVMKGFKHSEKVHVNLMLLEARMQAELLYALRAVMQYMT